MYKIKINVQGKNERELNFRVFGPTPLRKGAAGRICSICRFLIVILEILDCEQSLFFFRFSESNARASPVLRYQSHAWPFACLTFCSTDYRKKRDCL